MSNSSFIDWKVFLLFATIIALLILYIISNESLAAPGLILLGCISVTAFLTYLAFFLNSSPSEKLLKDTNENVEDIYNQLQNNLLDANNSLTILLLLRKKVHQNPTINATQLVNKGIIHHILTLLESYSIDDKRIFASVDLLNELLLVRKARDQLFSDQTELNNCVDEVMKAYIHVYSMANDNNEIANLLPSYKLVMTIGLIGADFPAAQSRLADRGAIPFIFKISFLNTNIKQDSYAKWGYWTLFNLSLDNPSNKAEIYHNGCIDIIIKGLKLYHNDKVIIRQALALLFNLLMSDSKTKYSIAEARQMTMTSGIVDIVHEIHREFKDVRDIIATSQGILDLIIMEWS
eukprot:gene8551-11557_t